MSGEESTLPKTYSTYEAKARFSEIVRKVRQGESVYISYRGKEVAEIRPVTHKQTAEEKLRRLEDQGIVTRPSARVGKLEPIAKRPGALARFLESRD